MRLSLRLQKFCLTVATCACLAGAGIVIAWGLRLNTSAPANTPTHERANQKGVIDTADTGKLTTKEFAQLWDRPLRRVLYDPPPPKPEVKQLSPLRLELLGTIIEPPNSMAIIRSEQGNTEYKRVGDAVGPSDSPASVVEIGPSEIVVERANERVTLGVQTRNVR